jgi:6-phosphofructokinase 1
LNNTIKRIAVLTSGGDAPGMNAAIRAVVRHALYQHLHVYGILRGYDGMIKGDIQRLDTTDVSNILHRGGTVLKTARSEMFRTPEGRQQAYENLKAHDIDACVVIGGNGTFTGAKLFSETFDIPMIGIPGTIDNDLYGTDHTIGYDTALNTAIDAIDKIRDTADSHNRLFFIEVMGRDAGFIALNSGIGVGAGSVIIPEVECSIDSLIESLKRGAKRNKLFNLVVVAEGSKCGNANEIAAKVQEKFNHYDTKVTVIGHLQRGGSPTCMDRVLASRLGFAAVDALLAGQRNVMVGILNDQVAYTSFDDAINLHKPVNNDLIRIAEILGM